MRNRENNNDFNDLFEKYLLTEKSELFTELVEALSPWIKGIISRYVKDEDDREDIFQETWIRVEQNKNDFDKSKSNVKSWIYSRYLKGLILHYLRDSKRSKERRASNKLILDENEEIDFIESLPADFADPEKNLLRLERTFWLKKSLRKLESKQQDVVLLHHFGGKQLDEISAMMKVEYATVRTWHYRALQKLEIELKKRLK
ncbi:MAG: sigma-70 family RNA polymerase sigma factor [Candidatus Kapabacteria bacterium]|nr:sigma-70 family RNA polymerase sigma factor [Candidatus Kapabacteria bacterium]